LFQKPFSLQGLARDPIQQEGINLGTHNLHEIAGKAIASRCVDVENTNAGVETKGGSREPGLGFQHGVKIVEDRVRRVDC
jgi:hypothetical protein